MEDIKKDEDANGIKIIHGGHLEYEDVEDIKNYEDVDYIKKQGRERH